MTCLSTACAVNEILISLMGDRIRAECCKLHDGGMSVDEINTILSERLIPLYEGWRREMLTRVMANIVEDNVEATDVPVSQTTTTMQ